jgi:hypothetical protein
MHKVKILFCLTLLSGVANSQNIFSALQLNEYREYKGVKPKKIVETNIFHNRSGKQVDRNIKTFDEAGMLLSEERFDENGNLKTRATYTNDTVNKLKLIRTAESWTQARYSYQTTIYTYDSNNHLTAITDKDANGNILQQTRLIPNEKGHPIELVVLDKNGNPYGKEIAVYLYERNSVVTSVVSNDGRTLSTDTVKISFRNGFMFPAAGETYNSHGDLTNWKGRNLDGSTTEFEEEYSYDGNGNCTEERIYKISIKGSGKRQREIDRVFKKRYTY